MGSFVYPKVLSEEETLERVLGGQSIARYGDGELKLMLGRDCVSQLALAPLISELRAIMCLPSAVLVGIPTLDPRCPKLANWQKLAPKFEPLITSKKEYGSAFITRPDNAPWINTPSFFDKIESLWRGQTVTFVGNGKRSLTAEFLKMTGAKQVDWVVSAYRDAYKNIEQLEREIIEKDNTRVIMCAGATATCLAARLAEQDFHAIDLGHIGMFWRRYADSFVEQREINIDTGEVEPNP